MKHRIIIRNDAENDIAQAALWYEQKQPNLGNEFLAEVKSAIDRASENPFSFPCMRRRPEVRRVLTKRFPYRVFFIRRRGEIVIFRVLHGARNEIEWQSKP